MPYRKYSHTDTDDVARRTMARTQISDAAMGVFDEDAFNINTSTPNKTVNDAANHRRFESRIDQANGAKIRNS